MSMSSPAVYKCDSALTCSNVSKLIDLSELFSYSRGGSYYELERKTETLLSQKAFTDWRAKTKVDTTKPNIGLGCYGLLLPFSFSTAFPPYTISMYQFSSLELRSSTHSSRARIANRMSPSDFLLAYVTLVERSAKARFLWRNKHVKRDLNRFRDLSKGSTRWKETLFETYPSK